MFECHECLGDGAPSPSEIVATISGMSVGDCQPAVVDIDGVRYIPARNLDITVEAFTLEVLGLKAALAKKRAELQMLRAHIAEAVAAGEPA